MGMLGRLTTLIKSNVNDAIDSMQDPAKEIDQMVRDMEDSAREARREVAQCMADEKRLGKRIDDLTAEIKTWEDRAATAVRAGDDNLARQGLLRKSEKEAERAESQKALQEQQVYVDQLTVGLRALDARVQDVKLRQGSLREKARASKKGGSSVSTRTGAFDDFERMSSKIDAVEAEASLGDELSGRTPAAMEAERKLNDLSEKSSLDDALAELKKKLGGP
ncbi:MAG TPA: PspA/IM30 family protein [Polyangia bacterium]|nr:PspA/IM30 family protein [Polyangia bacterium]